MSLCKIEHLHSERQGCQLYEIADLPEDMKGLTKMYCMLSNINVIVSFYKFIFHFMHVSCVLITFAQYEISCNLQQFTLR